MKLIHTLLLTLILTLSSMITLAGPVDVNLADAQTLEKNLKGIGKKKAKAIVVYRKKNGLFKSMDDLLKVKGIGRKTLEANRKNILLDTQKK
ncbi:MAG TPA: helix-hairpin-helix domain-containing protein [Gammaproteobacteria bacterium]|nr:helix-hairpin-helix domain-containing protein [Gammaproteobacteria bacterium]